MNANDKLKKWINHNYLTKGDRRMITDNTKWDDKDYYYDNFEDIMYDKIKEGIDLTEDELSELTAEYSIKEVEGGRGRWTVDTKSIVKLHDQYYAVNWQKGLTEMQPSMFYNQPYEVKKVEKMVPVTEWVPVKQDS